MLLNGKTKKFRSQRAAYSNSLILIFGRVVCQGLIIAKYSLQLNRNINFIHLILIVLFEWKGLNNQENRILQ